MEAYTEFAKVYDEFMEDNTVLKNGKSLSLNI